MLWLLLIPLSVSGMTIRFIIFSSSECQSCFKLKQLLLPEWEKEFNVKFDYQDHDIINNIKNFEFMLNIRDHFKKEKSDIPVVVIEDQYMSGLIEIKKRFPDMVKKIKKENKSTEYFNLNSIERTEDFVSLALLPVLYAGLVDGINPCAFATIIFLISYLGYLGKTRKKILLTGISYTMAVFITYLLIGMGLLHSIMNLPVFYKISIFINIAIASFTFVLAFLSLKDYFLARQGRAGDMILQLPRSLKQRIHKNIREKTTSPSLIISAVILGFMVSLFELACTGQIYLPTIIYLTKEHDVTGYLYLVIYNLMFILPLVIIFILFHSGLSSEKLSGFFQKNIPLIKFLTFILFMALGTILLLSVF